jgi:PRTRC genetic system protein B
MQVTAASMSATEKIYSLSNAILLYREHGNAVFASVHDIEVNKGGKASIMAGTPVSKTALVEMLKTLAPEDYAPAELTGSHILAKGNDHLVWYSKPKKRQVWFQCEKLGNVSAQTDHPGLVFIVSRDEWFVFAVKSRARPTPSTKLYQAPYFNVWSSGKICTGNVEFPKGAAKFDTEAWEAAFFRSYFTHPNVHEKGKLTIYRGGPFSLWRALMKGRVFPTESLVPAGIRLGDAFERMVKHGRS